MQFSIDGRQFEHTKELPLVQHTSDGCYLVQDERNSIEVYLLPRGGLSDGLMVDGIDASVETERQRIARERFNGSSAALMSEAGRRYSIKAPMPGLVKKVLVSDGEIVTKSSPVFILEAMKMENVLTAGKDGIIENLKASEGANVEKNTVLCEIKEHWATLHNVSYRQGVSA
jgi:biotin carboxyl carrier protein